MINEILEVNKISKKTNFEYIFNFSKIEKIHIQSPSLIKIKDPEERAKYFTELYEILNKNKFVKKVELHESGFINITLKIFEIIKYLQKSKNEIIKTIQEETPKKYIFDYGGPNIGKSMHVGHLRPLNIGRALYNMYKISGNECISDIHLGDWGIPISQILTFCYQNNHKIEDLKVEDLQKIYPEASKYSSENQEFKNKVNENLSKLNNGDEKLLSDWKITSELTIQNIKKILDELDHRFDLFYGESSVVGLIPEMVEDLKKNNYVRSDDGALVSNENTDPPILILKSDGTYLYMTTDLATVLDREKQFSPDGYFYIVDNRQSEHFKQLFSSIKYFQFSNSSFEHIGFGTINDTEGKPFKTRQGDVYPLESLREDIYEILNKKNSDTNAEILTNSVLVYSDLVFDRHSNYKFDINKFTNTEGKTAIYIQYTKVRIESVLRNVKQDQYAENFDDEQLNTSEENLIMTILKFSEIFNRSKNLKEPHHLAEYLYELCQKFNSFYKDVKILDDKNMHIQNRRVNVLIITLNILEIIFEILGIKAVDEM